tara:strand:- start:2877 stop:3470 length:594 start_codon:yes stop_codon:yes gene_type:complete
MSAYEDFVHRIGCIHRNAHGDGGDVIARIMSTCVDMLVDRGCSSVGTHPSAEEAVTQNLPLVHGESPLIHVYLHSEDKVGVKYARSVMEADPEAQLIVVSIDGCTPFTRKECDGGMVQFFTARELVNNITKHRLVPPHEKIAAPPEGTTAEQLPKLLTTDAVAKYYGWPVGSVVRVTRCFAGSEPIPYFRVVSAAIS